MIPLEEATKIVAEAMTDSYERGRGIGEAERKVIEAAKVWAEHAEQDPNDLSWDHQIHLFDAIEALLAAESD